ncbi:uncharacterized protein LOC143904786 [Temnothorax americanus]|uniref:uncharacterized protein LOC143904786 n=1 Tax=Temnothorax americanus TaxID=1964332 RepID=UPI0040691BDF
MDNTCFAWSVVAALHPAERHSERESSYPDYTTVLNLQGIEFPMTLKQIKKFERLNDISINVYTIEGEKTPNVLPIRLTDLKREKHVNLLYVQDPRDDNVGHFAWIKNLSRLVSSQLSRYDGRKYFCDRCLHYFHLSEKLEAHGVDCREINNCAIRLPSEDDKWLRFKNHSRKERLPFAVRRPGMYPREEGCGSDNVHIHVSTSSGSPRGLWIAAGPRRGPSQDCSCAPLTMLQDLRWTATWISRLSTGSWNVDRLQ